MQHAIVVFRIKWVWIWLRLPGTRVPSGGAFFGRIDYLRFKKKKKMESVYISSSYREAQDESWRQGTTEVAGKSTSVYMILCGGSEATCSKTIDLQDCYCFARRLSPLDLSTPHPDTSTSVRQFETAFPCEVIHAHKSSQDASCFIWTWLILIMNLHLVNGGIYLGSLFLNEYNWNC